MFHKHKSAKGIDDLKVLVRYFGFDDMEKDVNPRMEKDVNSRMEKDVNSRMEKDMNPRKNKREHEKGYEPKKW